MRDMNALQRGITLLALHTWRLLEAIDDYLDTVVENRRGLRRGAADPAWQVLLHEMAEPVREHRLATETGERRLMLATEFSSTDMATVLVEWDAEQDVMRMAQPAPAPALAVPVITGTGVVTQTLAHPVRAGRTKVQRAAKHRALESTVVAEVRQAERAVRLQLDAVVRQAMLALGLSLDEARRIMGAHHYESVLDRVALV